MGLAYRCFSCMSTFSAILMKMHEAPIPVVQLKREGTLAILEVYDLCPLLRPVRREVSESGGHSPGG